MGRFNFNEPCDYPAFPDARVELKNLQGHNLRCP
jgi:hypothetical protein